MVDLEVVDPVVLTLVVEKVVLVVVVLIMLNLEVKEILLHLIHKVMMEQQELVLELTQL